MGVVRLLLALSVVLSHCGPEFRFRLLDGYHAVQIFFMISGFYMALILNEKYHGAGSYRLFLSNRLLRIFPCYWVVVGLTVLFWFLWGHYFHNAGPLRQDGTMSPGTLLLLRLSDLLILGQEWSVYFAVNQHGGLDWTPNVWSEGPPYLWSYLLVPPAWSLSLELTFYLMAPLLVRRRAWVLVAGIVASMALRVILYFHFGLQHDPWIFRFFPTELAFFLAGSLAYRVYQYLLNNQSSPRIVRGITVAYVGLLLLYQLLPEPARLGSAGKMWLFHGLTWLVIPFLFLATIRSTFDRYIGELSYPIYILHWLVVAFVTEATKLSSLAPLSNWAGPIILVLTVLAAIVLNHSVSVPIERLRQRRARRLCADRPTILEVGIATSPVVPIRMSG